MESFTDDVLSLVVYDSRLGDMARIRYPAFTKDVSTVLCTKNETDISCDKDTLAFLPIAKNITIKNGTVYENNQPLFSVRDILKLPNL